MAGTLHWQIIIDKDHWYTYLKMSDPSMEKFNVTEVHGKPGLRKFKAVEDFNKDDRVKIYWECV